MEEHVGKLFATSSKKTCGFEECPNMRFITFQHNLRLWELTHQVWCSIFHLWVGYDCFKFGVQIFLVTLMLVHISSKKLCL